MIQHNIKVEKTARYFVLGQPSEKTKRIWFVYHGYAQLANYFLKKFESLDNEQDMIIAPEGLHRFYWSGFSGKVVASWMTKEDRLNDIDDYVNFLNRVYDEVISSFKNFENKPEIISLGFSQGTATVCRWITLSNKEIDRLIIWAGAFPEDINYFEKKELFASLKPIWISGNKDGFLPEEKVRSILNLMTENEIPFKRIVYEGSHTIDEKALFELKKLLEK
ncbi:MAG: alpha/beta hydrolase [Flavobacteriales bacterium]